MSTDSADRDRASELYTFWPISGEQSRLELENYKKHLESIVQKRTKKLRSTLKRVEHLSTIDPLTGCYNRQFLTKTLKKEMTRARRYSHPFSIILCDLDHFKQVNDLHGHLCGDHVLITFAQTIQSSIRHNLDWLVRYGGEEFLIVLPETDHTQASQTAERLRMNVEHMPLVWKGESICLTASFGVTTFDPSLEESTIDGEQLLSKADHMLYAAKAQGRNRVCC